MVKKVQDRKRNSGLVPKLKVGRLMVSYVVTLEPAFTQLSCWPPCVLRRNHANEEVKIQVTKTYDTGLDLCDTCY